MQCSPGSKIDWDCSRSVESLRSGLRIAQTQTEKKLSFFAQFSKCFLGNQKYR